MQILTNKNNLDLLKEAIDNAEEEILLCSGWIRSETLKKVFSAEVKSKIKAGELKLKIIIRLGEDVDVQITDSGVFKFVEELGGEIHYHRKLHTKLYVIDKKCAFIGSFNLTGGGFGNDERSGSNPETGVYTDVPAEVEQYYDRFYELWENETQALDNSILGFVLAPTSHLDFYILGVKELLANQFVQVAINENELILGKITLAESHADSYYTHPDQLEEPILKREFFEKYTYKNGVHADAVFQAVHGTEPQQVKIAKVSILSRIIIKDGKYGSTLNLSAPSIGKTVNIADRKLLKEIFNKHDFAPGVMISNDVEVGFDSQHLYNKHLSIFGSTGSGKSFFTKVLLSKYVYEDYCTDRNGRVIILDPHGEYARSLRGTDEGSIFKMKEGEEFEVISSKSNEELKSRIIKNAEELAEACEITFDKKQREFVDSVIRKNKGKSNDEIISSLKKENRSGDIIDYDETFGEISQIIEDNIIEYLDPILKVAKAEYEAEHYSKEYENNNIPSIKAPIREYKVRIRAKELFDNIEESKRNQLIGQIKAKEFEKEIKKSFDQEVKIISDDKINEIEDRLSKGEITFQQLDILEKMDKNKIYCIDLSDIHEENIRWELSSNIMRKIFDGKKEGESEPDTLFVIEEAHNFAPESVGKNNPAGLIIRKIAAEGRKFNLGLFVITQRPASVSKGVLSQCSTQVIFRLVNPSDITSVGEVVEGISEEELRLIPNFKRGQGIFTGVAIDESVLMKTNESRL